MLRSDNAFLLAARMLAARPPLRWLSNAASAWVAYPIAERIERRDVRGKVAELRRFYRLPLAEQQRIANERTAAMLAFAGSEVPYYRSVFAEVGFDPESVGRDPRFLEKLPFLTKDIIAEQGDRLLSRPLAEIRSYACRTGGSTGRRCVVYYDQEATDYSSAVTLYARERIGKSQLHTETHFACRFPGDPPPEWPTRETFKGLAMNRGNIFFDRFDEGGLAEMWRELRLQRPRLAHAHPSTMYAIARYVEARQGKGKAFDIFESSGELLEPHVRDAIVRILDCRVVDRYGLAETGVVGYEFGDRGLEVLTSEVHAETSEDGELILTGLRNRLMPLIRYRTGDIATVVTDDEGTRLAGVVGRIHDVVRIAGVDRPTHHIQDVLQHRVGGIDEFQIDARTTPAVLRIVLMPGGNKKDVLEKIAQAWPGAFDVHFVQREMFELVGERAKFRHVVTG